MVTMDTITAWINTNKAAYWAARDAMQNALWEVEDAYIETVTQRPADTVAACCGRIGREQTAAVIATLVMGAAWDGRISRRAVAWAQSVPGAWDEQAARKGGLYSDRIHRAHLDQIACEIAKSPA